MSVKREREREEEEEGGGLLGRAKTRRSSFWWGRGRCGASPGADVGQRLNMVQYCAIQKGETHDAGIPKDLAKIAARSALEAATAAIG